MANEFRPTVGGKVSKDDADKWIEKYDKDVRKDKSKDTKSVFYGKDVLNEILSKEGCAGISFFFAQKYNEDVKKETTTLVLVPTREDGSLIWDETSEEASQMSAYDNGSSCPPYCPK